MSLRESLCGTNKGWLREQRGKVESTDKASFDVNSFQNSLRHLQVGYPPLRPAFYILSCHCLSEGELNLTPTRTSSLTRVTCLCRRHSGGHILNIQIANGKCESTWGLISRNLFPCFSILVSSTKAQDTW